jgi:hypothetical protein
VVTFTAVGEYRLMMAFSFTPGIACITQLISSGCESVRVGDFQRKGMEYKL